MKNSKSSIQSHHWADQYAKKIIENNPDKKKYIVESGITPSGVVHIGNFREVMSQYLVYRALLDKKVNAEFLYIWDDYDRFRKVPKGIDKKFEQYIGMPLSKVPDPFECHNSWAEHYKEKFIEELKTLNIHPTFISSTDLYEKCTFSRNINIALKNTDKIQNILIKFRKKPLDKKWLPILVNCRRCKKETKDVDYIGDYTIKYKCLCGYEEIFDFRKKGNVKLRWRVDWASRWAYFGVDFESSGKDHKSQGGSFDTSSLICKDIFQKQPPIGPMYEFINTKGNVGKMSSSLGNTNTISDLLKIYSPEIIKYIYTAKINKPIDIPFDSDVFNIYNYYDEIEEVYFGKKILKNKKKEIQLKRMYELSNVEEIKNEMPKKISFKEAVNIVLYVSQEKIRKYILDFVEKRSGKLSPIDKKIIENRLNCAKYWIDNYAPADMKIKLLDKPNKSISIDGFENCLKNIYNNLNACKTQKDIEMLIYDSAKNFGKQPKDLFKILYLMLFDREKGPRLASFIEMIGKEKIRKILEYYIKR